MTDLTLVQVDWLSRFTGKPIDITVQNGMGFVQPDPNAPAPAEDPAARLDKLFRMRRVQEIGIEQSTKELLIDKATKSLDQHKEAIRKAFNQKIKDRDGKEHDLIDKRGEQKNSYDVENEGIQQATKKSDPGLQTEKAKQTEAQIVDGKAGEDTTVDNMYKMMDLIVAEKDRLEAAKIDRTTKGEWDPAHPTDETKIVWTVKAEALFTAKEIMNEIYTPLVRELIIPETVVPDKFSQTQQMVDGSNEAYIQECREKGTNTDMGLSDLLDAGKTLVSGLGNAASAFELANGASSTTIALTNMAISAVNFMLDVGSTVASGILLDQTSFTAMATDIAGLVGGALTAQFGGSSDPGIKALPGLVSGMISAGAGGFGGAALAAAQYLKDQKGKEFIDGLGIALANFLAGAINGAMAEVTKQTLADDKEAAALVSAFTGFAAAEIQSVAKNAVAARKADLIAAYNAGQRSKFATLLSGVAIDVTKNMVSVGAGLGTAKADADLTAQGVASADQTPYNDAIALQKQYGGLAATDAGAAAKAAIQYLESKEKDVLDYKKKKDEEIKDFAKKLESDLDAHRKALDSLDTDPAEFPDFKTMAAMIKQAEADKIKWQTLMSFASMSSSVLAAVMPALNAAGELITFAMESALLLKRTEAAYTWYQSKKDSINAVSPYASSIADLYGNQAEQAMQHGFMAGQHLVKAMLNFAAHFDPTGSCIAASLAVGVASATEEAVYKLYKRKALSDAWKQTEIALNNPKNRKAALIAREMNPTLAKYTIAYGALVEGDAMATRALNEIGLDTETLNNANGKVKDVAKFLKELYWEDNVVLDSRAPGIAGKQTKIKPPATTLTLDGWATSLAFWRENAKLAKTDPAPIIGKLLGKVEEFAAKAEADVTVAEYDLIINLLGKLLAAFTSFPVKIERDGTPTTLAPLDVSDGIQLYADKVDAQITLAKLARTRRQDADAQAALDAQNKAAAQQAALPQTASSASSDGDGDDAQSDNSHSDTSQDDSASDSTEASSEDDSRDDAHSSPREKEKVTA